MVVVDEKVAGQQYRDGYRFGFYQEIIIVPSP
jgi:hypothetical protein